MVRSATWHPPQPVWSAAPLRTGQQTEREPVSNETYRVPRRSWGRQSSSPSRRCAASGNRAMDRCVGCLSTLDDVPRLRFYASISIPCESVRAPRPRATRAFRGAQHRLLPPASTRTVAHHAGSGLGPGENRFGLKGLRATGVWPVDMRSAMATAVAGARVIPSFACPVAT